MFGARGRWTEDSISLLGRWSRFLDGLRYYKLDTQCDGVDIRTLSGTAERSCKAASLRTVRVGK